MEHTEIDTRCHLLELPAEMRNRIYKLVLPEQEQYYDRTEVELIDSAWQSTPLLKTCRQIRSDSEAIHYHERNFFIYGLGAIRWLPVFHHLVMKYNGKLSVTLITGSTDMDRYSNDWYRRREREERNFEKRRQELKAWKHVTVRMDYNACLGYSDSFARLLYS